LFTLGVVAAGLRCSTGDVTELNGDPLSAGDGSGATLTWEAGDGNDLETVLRENADRVAQRNAEWHSRYTREEQEAALAAMGVQTHTYDQLVAESMRKRFMALSAEEEGLIRSHFGARPPGEELAFQGRIFTVGDVQFDADELLERLRSSVGGTVEKGFGCIAASAAANDGCLSNGGCPCMANDGDGNPDTLAFFRPDTQRTAYFIVPDFVPDFVFNALTAVTLRIVSLDPPGDCLGRNTFLPVRRSIYDALDPFEKASTFSVPVTYGLDPCPQGRPARACSFFPSSILIMTGPPSPNGGGQGRTELGFIGAGTLNNLMFNSFYFTEDSAAFRGAIFHEFGHIMGRSHNVSDAATAKIPGTSVDPTVASVMDVSVTLNRANALSGDDVQVIKTLYSDNPNRANDACAYTNGFRTFGAIAFAGCPPNSIDGGTVCCDPRCGTCGGSGCSARFGTGSTTAACCTAQIQIDNVSCSGRLSGPCVLR
jgi:hypothetical protein